MGQGPRHGHEARARGLIGVLLITALGCSSSAEPEPVPAGWSRVIGFINPLLSSIQMVQAPISVGAGEPFSVVVSTLGSSTCTRADGATVTMDGDLAVLTPYDRVAPAGTGCTRDLVAFPRRTTVRFAQTGVGRLQIQGQDGRGQPIIFELEIPVH
jgi:hypothetical protein